jgi:hypothetical protein
VWLEKVPDEKEPMGFSVGASGPISSVDFLGEIIEFACQFARIYW